MHHLDNLRHKIKLLWSQLSNAYQADNMAAITLLSQKIDLTLAQEEDFLHQRARIHWLSRGAWWKYLIFFIKSHSLVTSWNIPPGSKGQSGLWVHGRPALSPDGIPVGFCEYNWDFTGDYITPTVLDLLVGRQSLSSFNQTNLVLIPKSQNPVTSSDFWPIGFCNTIY